MLAQRWEIAPFRSEKLTRYAEGQSCVNCGTCDGTVVHAHLAWPGIADKGMSTKCSDYWGAHLCFRCHHEADLGKYQTDLEWRTQMVAKTLDRIFKNGKARIT